MITYGRERFSGLELMDVSAKWCLLEKKSVRIDEISDIAHGVSKIHPGYHSTRH